MKMSEIQRPTAKRILEGILQAMFDSQEPLDEDLVLVPSVFDVLLHPKAFQELKVLMPRIKTQARKRMDEELEQLNRYRSIGSRGLLRRLLNPLLRLFFVDRYLQQTSNRPITYERAGDGWTIDFLVTANPSAETSYLAVETSFAEQAQPSFRGRPTITIRRRTTLLPDGRFETVLSSVSAGAKKEKRRSSDLVSTRRPTRTTSSTNVLARLSYEDNGGRHVYYMKKEQIIIGRRDDPAHYLDVALDTLPDVSREHARIRHDAASGNFLIKNVSRFGATVDGEKIEPSLNDDDEDVNTWHPLPHFAEIGLADAVFIHFEAL